MHSCPGASTALAPMLVADGVVSMLSRRWIRNRSLSLVVVVLRLLLVLPLVMGNLMAAVVAVARPAVP